MKIYDVVNDKIIEKDFSDFVVTTKYEKVISHHGLYDCADSLEDYMNLQCADSSSYNLLVMFEENGDTLYVLKFNPETDYLCDITDEDIDIYKLVGDNIYDDDNC